MNRISINILLLTILVAFVGCRKEKENTEEFLAPTTPMKRMAVLEDLTSVQCSMCTDGHLVAWVIYNKFHPNSLIILAVHAGFFADPSPSWPNFNSPFGDALIQQATNLVKSMLSAY